METYVESPWRCDKTKNPVGTDTVMIGAPPCQCQGCRADAEITRLRALVEELKADKIRINDEAETEIKRLREALDIDKAVDAAIFEWGSGKHREYDYGNAVYFKVNWRSLPGYRDAVDVQIGRRARKALEGGE